MLVGFSMHETSKNLCQQEWLYPFLCFDIEAGNQIPRMIGKSQGTKEEEASVSGPASLLRLKPQL